MSAAATVAPGFWRSFWLIAALELRQRLRSRALFVLAIVWFAVIGAVTVLAWVTLRTAFAVNGEEGGEGFPLFSLIVYFVLLFGTLVTPAISAGSIGAERNQATLATTQVTLVGTWPILLGKAFAAWATGIALLVVAAPFVIFSLVLSQATLAQLLMALLALALQLGVFTAIGVGLSALVQSQLFAIVIAYLVVAALSIGTLIAFALASGVSTSYVEVESQEYTSAYFEAQEACTDEDCWEAIPEECEPVTERMPYTPTHRIWWLLALNPYVVVADMVPPTFDDGYPVDLFGGIAYGMRQLQQEPEQPTGWDACAPVEDDSYAPYTSDDAKKLFETTVPVWWIGFGLQLALVALALWGGYRGLRTPARRLPRGSRVA